MTAVTRRYRVRIAAPNAPTVDGFVALTLDGASLADVPVIRGPTVIPTTGTSVMRPSIVRAVDVGGQISAAFASGGRVTFVGRLCDVQFSDDGGANWTTYGGGRLTTLAEDDGPGAYTLEISDESFRARVSGVFTGDNTTSLFPSSPIAEWRGWFRILPARGRVRTQSSGTDEAAIIARVELTADFLSRGGQEVTDALRRFAERDLVDNPNPTAGVGPDGNFRTLRLNLDGTDYPIVTFGPSVPGIIGGPSDGQRAAAREQILGSLDEPTIQVVNYPIGSPTGALTMVQGQPVPYDPGRIVTISCWIAAPLGSTLPTDVRPAYIWAPDANPSRETPLHIGITDAAHPWGTFAGGMHPATLTARVWTALGLRYDAAAISALEADASLPRLWLRVTETPENLETWMQRNVWGPCLLGALVGANGVRRLVDLRIPTDLDPFTLPLLNASNADAASWQVQGTDAITAIRYSYTQTSRPKPNGDETLASRVEGDGFIVEPQVWPLIEADTINAIGKRTLDVDLHGAMEPTDDPDRWLGYEVLYGGVTLEGAIAQASLDIFDLYRDGPMRGRIDVGRSVGEAINEGDIVCLDQSSLRGWNPETGARSGVRVVRVLSISRHPAYHELTYLDLGPRVQPLGPPSISAIVDADEFVVTVGGVPSGGSVLVEVAYTNDTDPPEGYPYRATLTAAGVVRFGNVPGSGFAHVRAKATAPNRIRSPYVSAVVTIAALPRIISATLALNTQAFGVPPVARGRPNALVGGVRVRGQVVRRGDNPGAFVLANPSDFDVAELTGADGVPLESIAGLESLRRDDQVLVELEPWTGFSGGVVTGSAGPRIVVSATVKAGDRPLAPTVEWAVVNRYGSENDATGMGEQENENWGGQGPQQPLVPIEPGVVPDPIAPDQQEENNANQPRPNEASVDLRATVRDPSGAGGFLRVWTNPASLSNASVDAPPDDVIRIDSTADPAVVNPSASPAMRRVRVPATGLGTKRMFFRFDSDTGATSGFVPPVDVGARDEARTGAGRDRWDDLGRGGFDTGYAEKKALLEEMKQEFLAGFRGEVYLSPQEIRDSTSFFTLMDGEGRAINNVLLESTVTDDGLRSISLFLAKPLSGDPDDLDSVNDGLTYRRVISVDSEGRVTVDSLAAGSVTAFAINVGSLDEITTDMGILVSGALIGPTVILDLGAESSEPVLDHASFFLLANGDAGFAGELLAATGTFFGDVTIGGSLGAESSIFLGGYGSIISYRNSVPGIADQTILYVTLDGTSGAPQAFVNLSTSANLIDSIFTSNVTIEATRIDLNGDVYVNGTPI